MPQLDVSTFATQVFWLVITFTTLFIIMWKIAIPKITGVLEARQNKIDDNLNRAEAIKKEAEAAIEAYEASFTDAKAEAVTAVSDATIAIAAMTQESETKLAKKLNKKLAKSEKAIQSAKTDALKDMRAIAIDVAQSASEKLIGEPLDTSTVEKAVDDAIA